mgnify:CR=1 FL=1
MNIALIGSGGREHALCQKIFESKLSHNIICIPGNAGTNLIGKNIKIELDNLGPDIWFETNVAKEKKRPKPQLKFH